MREQVTSARSEHDAELAELREELRKSREENLRLRDLLIGRDAELGLARGRLAELEEHAGRLAAIAARLQARLPALPRAAAARLRGLRGRRD
jgi:predicted nuclease with TOPRIM domain